MSEKRIEYDAETKRIKVYRSFSTPHTLVPKEELRQWTEALKNGEDKKGRQVQSVRYVFNDEETATYNQQRVAFAGLETYLVRDGKEKELGDDPNFSVREDFGIKGEDS